MTYEKKVEEILNGESPIDMYYGYDPITKQEVYVLGYWNLKTNKYQESIFTANKKYIRTDRMIDHNDTKIWS